MDQENSAVPAATVESILKLLQSQQSQSSVPTATVVSNTKLVQPQGLDNNSRSNFLEKDLPVISNQPLCDEFLIKHSSAFDTHMKLLSEYIDGIKGLNLTHKVAINKFIEEINRGHLHLLQQVFLNQSRVPKKDSVITNLQSELCQTHEKNKAARKETFEKSSNQENRSRWAELAAKPTSFNKPLHSSSPPSSDKNTLYDKMDPETKKDGLFVPRYGPKFIPTTQNLFLNAAGKPKRSRLSDEEFRKVQQKIKDILKIRESNFGITYIGTTAVGGVIMSFSSAEQTRRAEEILNQHSEDLQFTASLPTKSLPKMTLVGVDEDITDDKIADIIISQNPAVKAAVDNDGFIKVLFSTQYGENSAKRNVIFSCSPNVRNAIKKLNKLYIDFRHLPCYDRFYFKICYHCNGFNHFAKDCPFQDKPPTCLYCAENHSSKDCDEKSRSWGQRCSNCSRSNKPHIRSQAYTHNAASRDCPLIAKERQKRIINTDFGDNGF